ncbi:MAG: hypothetical protein VB858_08385 [Planctomycetaceae bacterium]
MPETATRPASAPEHSPRVNPVMGTTSYDKVSSGLICCVVGLIGLTGLLIAIWLSNRIPAPPKPVPFEIVDMPGGFEDGNPDETPELESPEEEIPDPSIAETQEEQTEITEMLEQIVELSDAASQQVEMVVQSDASATSGKVGSAKGTGGRPLGMGPGKGGFPRDQRWFIKFTDSSIDEYALQLDHFKIELGALFPDGRLIMLKDVSKKPPTKRTVQTGKGEDRLYMTWRGGSRQKVDRELFQKAGIDATQATIMHFYAPETEALLAKVEVAHRNRKTSEIRRTYFNVRKDGSGYKFIVTSQSYLR